MRRHIKTLSIDSYRGLEELNIENLGFINILVGDNNVGKTSVLEAIQFLSNPTKFTLFKLLRGREGRIRMNIADSFRYIFDIKQENFYKFQIKGIVENQEEIVTIKAKKEKRFFDLIELSKTNSLLRHKLKYRDSLSEGQEELENFLVRIDSLLHPSKNKIFLDEDGFEYNFEINKYSSSLFRINDTTSLKVNFIQTIDHLVANPFSNLIKTKEIKDKAINLLKEFDNTIEDLRYIEDDNRNYVPVIETNNGNYIPLSLYGDGLKKVLLLLDSIISVKDGILLIDEFETGLHTSIMKKVFKFMSEIAETLNVQLFLTTHSLEAVDKLLEGNSEFLEGIRLIRLKKKNGNIYTRTLDGNEALKNRKEYDMELRVWVKEVLFCVRDLMIFIF